MEKLTRRYKKKVGRHYFKEEREFIETNDVEEIKKARAEFKVLSFDQRVEEAIEWSRSILKSKGLPSSFQVWINQAGQWVEERPEVWIGGAWINSYVTNTLGRDPGSIEGLAAEVLATASNIKQHGPKPIEAFFLGIFYERLYASMVLDAPSRKGTKKIGTKKENRKQRTIEAFYKVEKRDKLSWAALTREIKKRWITTGPKDKAPGVDAVKGYLRAENLKN